MKKLILVSFLSLLEIMIFCGCVSAVRYDGPYEGRIIDAETKQPVEGVVVLGVWYEEYPTVAGAMTKYYDVAETATDRNGEFNIKGLGILVSSILPLDVVIFKAGYEHLSTSWTSLKTSKYLIQKKNITWEGNKAIIPLKKLTREERGKQQGPHAPPDEAPLEKVILMLKEIDKNDRERGLPVRGIWKGVRYE